MNLYEYPQSMELIFSQIEDTGEITPEIQDQLKSLEGERAETIDYLLCKRQELIAKSKAVMEEVDRLTNIATSQISKAVSIFNYLTENIAEDEVFEHLAHFRSVKWQHNPPSVEVLDESAIPAPFWIAQDPKLDKRAILAELKSDKRVAGVDLKQSKSLRVR